MVHVTMWLRILSKVKCTRLLEIERIVGRASFQYLKTLAFDNCNGGISPSAWFTMN